MVAIYVNDTRNCKRAPDNIPCGKLLSISIISRPRVSRVVRTL